MLLQTHGGGRVYSTSVECLFSITPMPGLMAASWKMMEPSDATEISMRSRPATVGVNLMVWMPVSSGAS